MIKIVHDRITKGRMYIYWEGTYVLRYRVIWEQYNGPIPKGYEIHHINENKLDDRIENLQMLPIAEHRRFHAKKRILSQASRDKISKSNSGKNNGMINAIGALNPAARSVINLTTGEIFETVRSASKKYSVFEENISAVCRGRRKKCAGCQWAYADNKGEF